MYGAYIILCENAAWKKMIFLKKAVLSRMEKAAWVAGKVGVGDIHGSGRGSGSAPHIISHSLGWYSHSMGTCLFCFACGLLGWDEN